MKCQLTKAGPAPQGLAECVLSYSLQGEKKKISLLKSAPLAKVSHSQVMNSKWKEKM